MVENLSANAGDIKDMGLILESERPPRPPEEGVVTHSNILAWRIPVDRGAWQLQSIGSQGVRHDRCDLA